MPSLIVWDLETVPDLQGYAAAKGLMVSNLTRPSALTSETSFRSTSITRLSALER